MIAIFLCTLTDFFIFLIILWLIINISDFLEMRKYEAYQKVQWENNEEKWDNLSAEEKRMKRLADHYISYNYLPFVFLNEAGIPSLPNFYLGGGKYYLLLSQLGFSEKEIEKIKLYCEIKNRGVTTA
jgi:hypothetical protein